MLQRDFTRLRSPLRRVVQRFVGQTDDAVESGVGLDASLIYHFVRLRSFSRG